MRETGRLRETVMRPAWKAEAIRKDAQVRSLYLPCRGGMTELERYPAATWESARAAKVRTLLPPYITGERTGQVCQSWLETSMSLSAWGSCPPFSVVLREGEPDRRAGPASKAVRVCESLGFESLAFRIWFCSPTGRGARFRDERFRVRLSAEPKEVP